jgi:hypothetical protein
MPIRGQHQRSILTAFWAAVIMAVITSTISLYLSEKGDNTAYRVEKAICVEIRYLEGAASAYGKLGGDLKATPEEREARQNAVKRTLKLAADLRSLNIQCPPPREDR